MQYSIYMKTPVNINGWRTIAMINSGATGNFMSFLFAQQNHMQIKKKKKPIRTGDGRRVIENGKRKNNPVTNANSATP